MNDLQAMAVLIQVAERALGSGLIKNFNDAANVTAAVQALDKILLDAQKPKEVDKEDKAKEAPVVENIHLTTKVPISRKKKTPLKTAE